MRGVSNWLIKAIASVGFLGYSPAAPGTVGTLGGVIAALALHQLSPILQGSAILLVFVLAIIASSKAEKVFGAQDSPRIVIDELIGFLIATALLPVGVGTFAAAFFLFRLFDVLKMYPANRLEHIRGGWGVVLDDVVAGLYTAASLQIIFSFVSFG